MKFRYLVTCLLFSILFVSCVQDEALNAEADIVACVVSDDILKRDPIIENTKVTLMVRSTADLTLQAPLFDLTPGATIEPASGSVRDFTTPQYYTVTSQDGNWHKKYQVAYVVASIGTEFQFENVKQKTTDTYLYDVFYEIASDGSDIMDWASGNAGFALTGTGKLQSESFPTYSIADGKIGKGVMLETKKTGKLGESVKMPLAAGNLFMGVFDFTKALTNPLEATQLGLPYDYAPTFLKGYYKYKAGDTFEEEGKPVGGKKDTWDVYAIFYETDANTKTLDATNRFTHPNLISIARIADKDRKETDEWTEFYIPFVNQPGKSIDKDKLNAGRYNLSIVFSSSIDGDYFKGAPGSVLCIDEVEIIYAAD